MMVAFEQSMAQHVIALKSGKWKGKKDIGLSYNSTEIIIVVPDA